VGALANEGGLSRDDFGHIKIRPDFSIVELPADLPRDVLGRLKGTRISGRSSRSRQTAADARIASARSVARSGAPHRERRVGVSEASV
jgi:ATP-dependent RNA helicase DeaD